MGRQFLKRFDRVARAIENHVGGIEIDFEIGTSGIVQEAQESVRRFLPGFQRECLAMLFGAVTNPAHHAAHRDVIGIGMILRHESDMAGDAFHAERGSKVASLDGPLFSLLACSGRNEADGTLNGGNVRVILAGISADHRRDRKLGFADCFSPLDGRRRSERKISADSKLPGLNAQLAELGQMVAASPKHDTYFHEILSPFFVRASNIASASRTDSAELDGVQSDGWFPVRQHSAKYDISAA